MATATKPRMKDEGSRMKRRRRAEGGRRKGHEKRPETQGDFYVTGVKTLTVAKVPGLRAAACVVNDRGAYHAGFRLIAGLQSPANCMRSPRASEIAFPSRRQALHYACGLLIEAARRTEREVKAAKLKRSLAALAERLVVQFNKLSGRSKTKAPRPKTESKAEGGRGKGEGRSRRGGATWSYRENRWVPDDPPPAENGKPKTENGRSLVPGPQPPAPASVMSRDEVERLVARRTEREVKAAKLKRSLAALAERLEVQFNKLSKRSKPQGPRPKTSAGTALVPGPQPPAPASVMSRDEVERLENCENVIRANLSGFIDLGNALATIQRERLYRAKYPNFEAYCKAVWDFGKSHAHRLINGAEVRKLLEVSPIGDSGQNGHGKRSDLPDQLVLPETESQVRPLTRLASDAQKRKAWARVLKTAPRGADNLPRVTAEIVENVVRGILPPRKDEGGRMKDEGAEIPKSRNPQIPAAMSGRDGMQFNRELEALDAHARKVCHDWPQPQCRERFSQTLRAAADEAMADLR